MLFGPEAGLTIVDALTAEPALKAYHLLPSVRGDLLKKLGRFDEARTEFERAAASRATSASADCCSSVPSPAPRRLANLALDRLQLR